MQEIMNLMPNNTSAAENKTYTTGTLCFESGAYTVKTADGKVYGLDGVLPANCKEGDKIAVCVKGEGAEFYEDFGSSAEAEPNIKAMLRDKGLDSPFHPDAIMQGKETAFTEITAYMAKRIDLRGKTIVTLRCPNL